MSSSYDNHSTSQNGQNRSSNLVSEARDMWRRFKAPLPAEEAPSASAAPQPETETTGAPLVGQHMSSLFEAAEQAAKEILAEAIRERSQAALAELEALGSPAAAPAPREEEVAQETAEPQALPAREPRTGEPQEPPEREQRDTAAPSPGASLVAMRMAMEGSDDDAIEERLRAEFGVSDWSELVSGERS